MADFSDLVGEAEADFDDLRDEPYVPSFAVLPQKFYSKVLLLSAGGSDLCAGGALANHLEPFDPDRKRADHLRRSYQGLLDAAIAWYERICRDVRGNFADVTIICHGYDYAIPKSGRWFGRPMEGRGITDRGLQRAIAVEMADQFNHALKRMADVLPVVHVDCRTAVDAGGWFDELLSGAQASAQPRTASSRRYRMWSAVVPRRAAWPSPA